MRLLLIALLACACSEDEPARPNVLVVSIDTLRLDAVGPGTNTPAFDAFFAESTWFRGARTTASLTLPAHASLFSGLLPSGHGNHGNTERLDRDAHDFSLLAEEFRAAGYATGAFVSSHVMGPDVGLDAGFDYYTVPKTEQTGLQRLGEVLPWLAQRDGPWFAWVHFWDPHDPYEAWAGDDTRKGAKPTDPVRAIYASEVRRVDAALERLLAAVGPDTIVVLVSDHGEAFGEHQEEGHGPLCYGTTIDALLAVRGPGLAAGKVDTTPRSICDVAPTLRRWCGLRDRPADGSLLTEPPQRLPIAVSIIAYRVHGWGQCFSVTDGRYSLVESGPRVELFDREADPDETQPLELAGHPAYEKLDRALAEYRRSGLQQPDLIREVMTPYGVGRRGYVRYLMRPENAKLQDPVPRGAWWTELQRLRRKGDLAARMKRPDVAMEAVERFAELEAKDPRNPCLRFRRAYVQRKLAEASGNPAWLADAARAGREAVELGYNTSPVLEQVLEDAAESGNEKEMRAALALLTDGRVRNPSLACLKLVMRIARVLGDKTVAEKILAREGDRFTSDAVAQLRRLLG